MRYKLMMRSRPDAGVDVAEKHAKFMRALSRLRAPWALKSRQFPPAREPGSQPSSSVDLTPLFRHRAGVRYANRWALRDTVQDDDYFTLEFNPERERERYRDLVVKQAERLVAAFDAYFLKVEDEQFTAKYFEAWRKKGYDDRDGVFRLSPVNYFDEELCRRAFGLTSRQVRDRLADLSQHARGLRGGVHVCLHVDPLPFEEADALCAEARRRLPNGPKHRRKRWRPPPKRETFGTFGEVVPKLAGGALGRMARSGVLSDGGLMEMVLDYSSESMKRMDRFLLGLLPQRRRFSNRQWGDVLRWRSDYVQEVSRRGVYAEYGELSNDML